MAKQLEKTYNPAEVEGRIYQSWMEGGYFTADTNSKKEPFTIVMPPPNITGQLHLGHTLDGAIQDILTRFKRMSGFEALWLPGTDHAGIATQIKVEENLKKEKGLSRHDLGREEFLKLVWAWKDKYGDRIVEQFKKIGVSCDWSRLRFTLDEGCSRAVREAFVSLYEKGYIYKGLRITNCCPECNTALSDTEVEYEEQDSFLWYIKYPIKGESGYITVATTRPETMLGDAGIAVSPDDERYKSLIGKTAILPLVGREIPIFADEYVDKEFGTGCVKVTPCHDPNDFEMGRRHGLEEIIVISESGKINKNGGEYEGLDRYDARKRIVEDLTAQGLLIKTERHTHSVGCCYRCGQTVEPLASVQWFVKMKPLAAAAIDVVKDGRVKFVPEKFEKIYLNWMENVRDWCISRQLWWGHRIPAFYCDDCGHMAVSKEDITVCPACGSKRIRQEEDVLDTWFSSALWPFSTLGWPDKTPDLEKFYPTTVLVTAYDIIFFWVARMIFSGMEHMGKEPFKEVLIHGLIRDKDGKKMSKSAGNGVDPVDMIERYGADALRFMLVTGNAPGSDSRFYEEKAENARNFANKIWNASRFALMNLTIEENGLPEKLSLEDKWILSRLNRTAGEVNENLNKYEIGLAVSKLYDFIWDDLCDWYVELIKPRLFESNSDEDSRISAQRVLLYVLTDTLKLLHPVMPFITEEIYQTLPHDSPSIMICDYPVFKKELDFPSEEASLQKLMALIKAVRNRRSEMNIPPSQRTHLYIETEEKELFEAGAAFFEKLAGASGVTVGSGFDIKDAVQIVTDGAKTYIPLAELIDKNKELARLEKEKQNLLSEAERCEAKLSNEGFTAKAPAALVQAEKEKLERLKENLEKLSAGIEEISKL